ncbi:MAG: MFS transporter [Candidatus Limnocylindria bacterium]
MSDATRARLAYVTLFTAVGAWAPHLPVYYRSLGLPLTAVGGLAALAATTGMLAAPAWGTLADRYAAARWVLPAPAFGAAAGDAARPSGERSAGCYRDRQTWLAMASVAPLLDARGANRLRGPQPLRRFPGDGIGILRGERIPDRSADRPGRDSRPVRGLHPRPAGDGLSSPSRCDRPARWPRRPACREFAPFSASRRSSGS